MPEEYVQPYSGLVECHALQDAAPDAEPHQAEVLIVHFVLAVLAQAS
ncbi:molecular chaperone Tir [Escherichia coli]|nr:molecular chaperone Tir [Escherichia coli]